MLIEKRKRKSRDLVSLAYILIGEISAFFPSPGKKLCSVSRTAVVTQSKLA